MRKIVADVNIEGHVRALTFRCSSEYWREIWEALDVRLLKFADLGLERAAKDTVVWRAVVEADAVLITGNRNDDGPDSLEQALREANSLHALPIITLADPDRVLTDDVYRDKTIDRLMEYLVDVENLRGTGRLYIP